MLLPVSQNAACGDGNFRVRRWQSPRAAFEFPHTAFFNMLWQECRNVPPKAG